MIEQLLELENISLIPADLPNIGNPEKISFSVINHEDGSASLPIFTAPMASVVSGSNYQAFYNKGIRPILSRVEDLNYRLEGCQYIFAAFTLREIQENFLITKRISNKQFKICIETGNGHDSEIFNVALGLRKTYGNQVCIMAGNIGNPKIYVDYCKAGIDYARVGFGCSSLVNKETFGFYYPMASLLIDILGVRNTSCAGLKQTKIIADGGIMGPVDIVKCIALGADYVMLGRAFAKLAEASGPVASKQQDGTKTELNQSAVAGMSKIELSEKKIVRLYSAQATYDPQGSPNSYDIAHNIRRFSEVKDEWVSVTSNLQSWSLELFEVFQNAFLYGRAATWNDFKANIKYVRISQPY